MLVSPSESPFVEHSTHPQNFWNFGVPLFILIELIVASISLRFLVSLELCGSWSKLLCPQLIKQSYAAFPKKNDIPNNWPKERMLI
jgi:hypothetical protein